MTTKTIEISFLTIHCSHLTQPINYSDQIYFVAVPYLVGKSKDGDEWKTAQCRGALSQWTSVLTGQNYKPTLRGQAQALTVHLLDNTKRVEVGVIFAERDSGKHYERMAKDAVLDAPSPVKWDDVAVPDDVTKWENWAAKLSQYAVKRLVELADDDFIAKQFYTFEIKGKGGYQVQRFLEPSQDGGDYSMSLEWRVIETPDD